MSWFSKYRYYSASILSLLRGFDSPRQIMSIFLNHPGALPTEVRLRKTGWRFRVRQPLDVWVIKETCIDGDYLWGEALVHDGVVVDIGAGLGDFTVLAAKQCPDGLVHAYEPLEGSFALLQDNLTLNHISNVQVFQQACASSGRTMAPVIADVEAVSTRFAEQGNAGGVEVVSLANILDRLPGGRCDFLKIDCEGCEFDLLLNSPPETLARVGRISAEIHEGYGQASVGQLVSHLRSAGFDLRQRPNPVHDYLGLILALR